MDGSRHMPTLTFSPTELMALVFSRDLLKPLDGTYLKTSLDSAFHKAAAALPPEGTTYVRQMRGYFSVGLGSHKTYRQHQHTIEQLTRAIGQTRTVQMRYYAASHDSTRRREVDPYRLWYADGALYLIAYCHLRRDVRMFAVDRIRSLTITNHPCQMPLGFDLEAYVRDVLVVMRGKPIEVELLFDRPTSAWVRDRQWHPSQKISEHKDGCLTMVLRVADTRELLGWILHFGSGVRVIQPETLRDQVREEARKIFQEV
jgi:predicted DNA-binding transcriptional regulator YafY